MLKLMIVLGALVATVGLVAAVVLWAGQTGRLRGQPPATLGVDKGRLAPPSPTPNSVHSQAQAFWPDHPQTPYAQIEPLTPPPGQTPAQALDALAAWLGTQPGVRIVKKAKGYLYAECETPRLRFVDDLELWADPAKGVVQVRSASRLGRKDFGVNRARVEALRAALAQQRPPSAPTRALPGTATPDRPTDASQP